MTAETNEVKVLAFYLPQYHTFPENDAWWGEGFTEWTNVRKAEPLYRGHYQPEVPLGDNYYDLADYSKMEEQMAMAKKHGLFGFCYYHYWFGGKLLMEKPLETMRDHDGEKLPYCLCWANEPWTRAWDGKDREILMPQNYGGEEEWEAHFRYLLTFFRDPAYIIEDGCPVLVIYRCSNIVNCEAMAEYWDKRAKEEGFSGIYLIEEINSFQEDPVLDASKAYLEFEPAYTSKYKRTYFERGCDKARTLLFNRLTGNNCLHVFDFSMTWNNILRRREPIKGGKKRCPGAFARWDNTPRRGRDSVFYAGAAPKPFERFMRRQLSAANEQGCPYLFINAWNEWGEGAYMEPDTRYGFAFLNALKRAERSRKP